MLEKGNLVKVIEDIYQPMTSINIKGEIGEILEVNNHLHPYRVNIKGTIWTLAESSVERVRRFKTEDAVRIKASELVPFEYHNKIGKIASGWHYDLNTNSMFYDIVLDEEVISPVTGYSTLYTTCCEEVLEFDVLNNIPDNTVKECTCKIMDLMTQGCKCGFIQIERGGNI